MTAQNKEVQYPKTKLGPLSLSNPFYYSHNIAVDRVKKNNFSLSFYSIGVKNDRIERIIITTPVVVL